MAIVGVGAMGGALASGLLEAGWPPADLTLIEAYAPRAEQLRSSTGCHTVSEPAEGITDQDVIVLAVKPQGITTTLEQLAGVVGRHHVVVALVAGVPLAVYERSLPGVPIVRTMPNTPALVGEGVTGMAGGRHASTRDLELATTVLSAVGGVEEVGEPLIDAVTAVSGSGPAYAYLLAEAMTAAGVAEGLDPEVAHHLASQTIKGAGAMMVGSADDPATLRERVTSPGGTTAAALRVMESGGFRELVGEAVAAAAARSRELGEEAAG